jgi:hypothetical protein
MGLGVEVVIGVSGLEVHVVSQIPFFISSLVYSNTGVVGSNTTRGMHVCVCLFRVCVAECVGSGLPKG